MATMTVAVLGAGGTMGFAMARNLLRAGHGVQAWNRTAERARPLEGEGATLASTPAEAVRGADAVLTMLTDADAVIAAVDGPDGALVALPRQAVWLQTSTIGIDGSDRCAALAAARDVAYVDAPVLGTKQVAEAAQLVTLASGPDDPAVRERAAAVFDAVAMRTLWLGAAGAGSRMKLVTNSWLVGVVAAGAESIALAQALGLDPADFLAALGGGALDLPYLRIRARAMVARDFTPAFRLVLAAKDARLAVEAAQGCALTLPVIETIARQLTAASDEHGEEDLGAVFLTVAPERPV